MTNEEAIKELEKDRRVLRFFEKRTGRDEIKRALFAQDLAIEALEKQLPKKKKKRNECPECGYSYAFEEYCPNCGQAMIDWSGKE